MLRAFKVTPTCAVSLNEDPAFFCHIIQKWLQRLARIVGATLRLRNLILPLCGVSNCAAPSDQNDYRDCGSQVIDHLSHNRLTPSVTLEFANDEDMRPPPGVKVERGLRV